MARSSDSPNLGFMVDIETLGTSTESVVVQLAIQPWLMDDESVKIAPMFYDIPIGPQLDMIPARSVSADTLGWWMKQSDAARESINFIGGDFEELKASMLHMIRQFSVIANGQHLLAPVFHLIGHHRRFVQHDTLAAHIDQRVGCSKVNGHVRREDT